MDLNFKILWFEDDSSAIDSLKPVVENHLDDLGFKLKHEIKKGVPENLLDVLKADDWDLILTDFGLATGSIKGDQLIQKIRDHEFFTDIIFYSDHPQFREEITKQQLEGVFFCQGRANLREKVKKIIELTIKKKMDVSNLRGLIIAETIDLVKQMDEIILCYMKLTQEKRDFFKEKLFNEEFFTDAHKFRLIIRILDENISNIKKMKDLPENSSSLGEIEVDLTELSQVRDDFTAYQSEIIQIRNYMAHARCSETKKNTLVCKTDKGYRDKEFNDEECKKIRKNLIKHSAKLESIYTKINN